MAINVNDITRIEERPNRTMIALRNVIVTVGLPFDEVLARLQ